MMRLPDVTGTQNYRDAVDRQSRVNHSLLEGMFLRVGGLSLLLSSALLLEPPLSRLDGFFRIGLYLVAGGIVVLAALLLSTWAFERKGGRSRTMELLAIGHQTNRIMTGVLLVWSVAVLGYIMVTLMASAMLGWLALACAIVVVAGSGLLVLYMWWRAGTRLWVLVASPARLVNDAPRHAGWDR